MTSIERAEHERDGRRRGDERQRGHRRPLARSLRAASAINRSGHGHGKYGVPVPGVPHAMHRPRERDVIADERSHDVGHIGEHNDEFRSAVHDAPLVHALIVQPGTARSDR
jgi:hypothetical protein